MHQLHRLVTSLVFAAHALLGCGAHHACQHGSAFAPQSVDHDCLADHHGHSHQPADEHQRPSLPSRHATCSFVKADTVRIDQGNQLISWLTAIMPSDDEAAVQSCRAACEPIVTAEHSSAHLYVWHCALLI